MENNENYRALVNKAESAYQSREYLQAFLIQSCLIEATVKEYAENKLKPLFSQNPILNKKYKRFELARLIDELYLLGKISSKLYKNLSDYRAKRNDVIHDILKYGSETKELRAELRKIYKLGTGMKGFIVEDILNSKKGKTVAELAAEQEAFFRDYTPRALKAMNESVSRDMEKLNDELRKLSPKRQQG